MAVGKGRREKGEAEVEDEEMVVTAAGKGEKGSSVAEKEGKGPVVEKGEKGSSVAEKEGKVPMVEKGEKGSTVAEEEAGKELAGGDMIALKISEWKPFEVSKEEETKEVSGGDVITLKSSDGKRFEVSKEEAARLSTVLAEMIAGGCIEGGIVKLENVGSEPLERVVDYCNKHANSDPSAAASSSVNTAPYKELEDWDRELVGRLSQNALFDLVEAANFLKMDGLFDVTCRKIAYMIKDKSPGQIREMFNIKSDFTKEEEEEIRRQHAWAFKD